MAKFFLRTSKEKGNTALHYRFKYLNCDIRISTGISVDVKTFSSPTKWKKYVLTVDGKAKAEQMRKVEEAVNEALKDNEKSINAIADAPERTKEITRLADNAVRLVVNEDARTTIENIRKREQEEAEKLKDNLESNYAIFLRGIKDGSIKQKRNNKSYTKGTIKVWDGFGKHLKKFCKGKPVTFDMINQSVADRFTLFLERQGLLPKTINKQIGCMKRLCNWAAANGDNSNAVSLRVWNEKTIDVDERKAAVYLTEEELDALYDMKLSGTREQVRDLFFLGYLTSQRFSDYANITRDNFQRTENGTDLIGIIQRKTGKYIEIPITDKRLTDIAMKYNYSFPRIELQNFTDVLKSVLKTLAETVPSLTVKYPTALTLAEKNKEKSFVILSEKEADGQSLTQFERRKLREMKAYSDEHNGKPLWERNIKGVIMRCKYELISSHSARRSGITNMVKDGILTEREMRSISGHTSEKNFNAYVRLGTREQAERIAEKIKTANDKKVLHLNKEA